MRLTYLPMYGHSQCPHCENDFDLASASPTFAEAFCGDVLLYVMCSKCHEPFQRAEATQRKLMSNKCFVNVKLYQHDSKGSRKPWAVTTALTMLLNGDDLVRAIERGAGLSKLHYLGILNGEYDITQYHSADFQSAVWGKAHRGSP